MLDKIKEVLPGTGTKTPAGPVPVDEKAVDNTTVTQKATTSSSDLEKAGQSDGEIGGPEYQAGVQEIEAALTVWTKWHLVAAYGMYVYTTYLVWSGPDVVMVMLSERELTNNKGSG